jgi:hypothetical protein
MYRWFFSLLSLPLASGYSDRAITCRLRHYLLRLLENAGSANDPNQTDVFGPMPELPSLNRRWTVRRKAAVIEAVRGGWDPIEEVCRLYKLSVDEFLAWERDIDRHGLHGRRSRRYQIYRDTDVPRQ